MFLSGCKACGTRVLARRHWTAKNTSSIDAFPQFFFRPKLYTSVTPVFYSSWRPQLFSSCCRNFTTSVCGQFSTGVWRPAGEELYDEMLAGEQAEVKEEVTLMANRYFHLAASGHQVLLVQPYALQAGRLLLPRFMRLVTGLLGTVNLFLFVKGIHMHWKVSPPPGDIGRI